MTILFLIFGVLSGYFSGLLGISAGCFLMPLLIYVGIPYAVSVNISVMFILVASLAGTLMHRGMSKTLFLVMAVPAAITYWAIFI